MMQTRLEIELRGKIGENACITATFPVIDDCSDSIEKHPTTSEHAKKRASSRNQRSTQPNQPHRTCLRQPTCHPQTACQSHTACLTSYAEHSPYVPKSNGSSASAKLSCGRPSRRRIERCNCDIDKSSLLSRNRPCRIPQPLPPAKSVGKFLASWS